MRRVYDYYALPFSDYLNVHHSELHGEHLVAWNFWQEKHLNHVFTDSAKSNYSMRMASNTSLFNVDIQKTLKFYKQADFPDKMEEDIRRFLAFLCGGINISSNKKAFLEYYSISWNQWLESDVWDNPSRETDHIQWSITKLSKSKEGNNYLRTTLSNLPFFDDMVK